MHLVLNVINIFSVFLLATTNSFGQDRTIPQDYLYFDYVSPKLQNCFYGWQYVKTQREWVGNLNVISNETLPKSYCKSRKSGYYRSDKPNIISLQTASFVWDKGGYRDGMRFYVLFWEKWDGYYEYPNLMINWHCVEGREIFVFPESEWARIKTLEPNSEIQVEYWYYLSELSKTYKYKNDAVLLAMSQSSLVDAHSDHSLWISMRVH